MLDISELMIFIDRSTVFLSFNGGPEQLLRNKILIIARILMSLISPIIINLIFFQRTQLQSFTKGLNSTCIQLDSSFCQRLAKDASLVISYTRHHSVSEIWCLSINLGSLIWENSFTLDNSELNNCVARSAVFFRLRGGAEQPTKNRILIIKIIRKIRIYFTFHNDRQEN